MFTISKQIRHAFLCCKYINFRKIKNYGELFLSYLQSDTKNFIRKKILPSFISIEATNFCNLQCPECPVGTSKKQQNNKKVFDSDLFHKIITELKPTLTHVILYFQGEPFLHNHLTDLINFIHTANIYCSTSTNGQFLTKEISKKVVLSGLDKLIVSIDGSTQEIYEKYRVGGQLKKAITGIEEINYWKKELNSPTPFIEIQFLVLKTNEFQIPEMKKLAKRLKADKLSFKTAQLYNYENGNELMPTQSKYSRYKQTDSGNFEIKRKQKNRCWRMWSGAVINTEGEVVPCCFDKKSEHSYGNLYTHSFSEIWHNKKASCFRESILENRKQYEMCRNCNS